MSPGQRQLVLPLAHRPLLGRADFLVSPSNKVAFDAVTGPYTAALALTGPAGAGKTHLASVWGEKHRAVLVMAADLKAQMVGAMGDVAAVVIEDADRLRALPEAARADAETALFHAINLCRAEDTALLVTGREAPGHWVLDLPDLRSRIEAMNHVAIAPPDDVLLSSILDKLFGDRQISATPELTRYLVVRMERSFAAAERIVDHLDRTALSAGRAVNRSLAAEIFASEPGIIAGTGDP
ncbi:MAG: chromosomal replication initiator DnaA [Pseudomonadota bacterium]